MLYSLAGAKGGAEEMNGSEIIQKITEWVTTFITHQNFNSICYIALLVTSIYTIKMGDGTNWKQVGILTALLALYGLFTYMRAVGLLNLGG